MVLPPRRGDRQRAWVLPYRANTSYCIMRNWISGRVAAHKRGESESHVFSNPSSRHFSMKQRNLYYSASSTRPIPSISFHRWTERQNWNDRPSNFIFPPTTQASKHFKIHLRRLLPSYNHVQPSEPIRRGVTDMHYIYVFVLCRFRSFSSIAFRERRSTPGHRAR